MFARNAIASSSLAALLFALVLAPAAGCTEEAATGGAGLNNGGSGADAAGGADTIGGGDTGNTIEPDCADGTCTCPDNLVVCGDACVDLSTDPNHCGSCGEECGRAGVCVSGACQCPDNAVQCGRRECADLSRDPENCGQCGRDCDQNEQCVSGSCEPLECSDGLVACAGECVDLSVDPENCGECRAACFPGEQCSSGQCTCPQGNAQCEAVGNYGTVVGGSCDRQQDCADGSQCLQGGDFPDGTCTKRCSSQDDCPAGTACVDQDGGSCLLRCTTARSCRDGYDCDEADNQGSGGDPRVCMQD